MALLLDDLLDVARITRGHIALRMETVNLCDTARSAVEALGPFLAEHETKLVTSIPDTPLSCARRTISVSTRTQPSKSVRSSSTDTFADGTDTTASSGDLIQSNPDNGSIKLTVGSKNFTEQLVLGDPNTTGTDVGPVIDEMGLAGVCLTVDALHSLADLNKRVLARGGHVGLAASIVDNGEIFGMTGTIDVLRKQGFRVVVPDQIGFGRSSKPIWVGPPCVRVLRSRHRSSTERT